jgi:hypothetical protein
LHKPRNELPVRKQRADEAERKINGLGFHPRNLADIAGGDIGIARVSLWFIEDDLLNLAQ